MPKTSGPQGQCWGVKTALPEKAPHSCLWKQHCLTLCQDPALKRGAVHTTQTWGRRAAHASRPGSKWLLRAPLCLCLVGDPTAPAQSRLPMPDSPGDHKCPSRCHSRLSHRCESPSSAETSGFYRTHLRQTPGHLFMSGHAPGGTHLISRTCQP